MAGVFKPDVSGSGGTAASQADQETGTAIDVFVSPGRQQYHPSACKAWAKFSTSGGTVTLDLAYNVSSITDNNTGDFTFNFSTAFSGANYAAALSGRLPAGSVRFMENMDNISRTTTALRVYCLNDAEAPADPAVYSGIFFGDQ